VVSQREKLSFIKIKREEVGRNPVGYVSYSVFKVSDVMRKIQAGNGMRLSIISIEVMFYCNTYDSTERSGV